jgi:hypothetical protein
LCSRSFFAVSRFDFEAAKCRAVAPVEVVRVGSAFLARRREIRGSEVEVSFREEAIMRGVQPAPSW